jgi:hypothetical protein
MANGSTLFSTKSVGLVLRFIKNSLLSDPVITDGDRLAPRVLRQSTRCRACERGPLEGPPPSPERNASDETSHSIRRTCRGSTDGGTGTRPAQWESSPGRFRRPVGVAALGTTLFFDEQRSVSVATTAYWEFHSEKEDTSTRVGQILTLQGGAGKALLGGGLVVGAAYYAQWKLTDDELADFVLPGGTPIDLDFPNKHRVFGFGPDVTLPLASGSRLFALFNIRYMWETGAHVKTEGQNLLMTATVPIPSVRIK